MKKRICCLLVLWSIGLMSQIVSESKSYKEIDSLLSQLDIYNSSSTDFYMLLDRSRGEGYEEIRGKIYLKLSVYYRKKKMIDSAFYNINKAMFICRENDFKPGLHYSYLSLGNLYGELQNYEKSLEYFLKAYDFYKKGKDTERFKNVLQVLTINIASTYSLLGDYEKARTYYYNHINDPLFDKKSRYGIQLYQNIGTNYKREGDYDNAVLWLKKGLESAIKNNYSTIKNDILLDLCKTFLIQNKNKEAKYFYDRIDTETYNWDKDYYLGVIYLGMNRLKVAESLLRQNVKGKQSALKRMNTFLKLSEVYSKRQMWEKAFNSKERYYRIKDSIGIERNKSVIKNNELGFKLIEEEMSNKQLETDNKLLQSKNRIQFYVLIGVVIFSFGGVFCFFLLIKNLRINKKLKELKKVERELLEDKVQLRENELNMTLIAISNRQKMLSEIKKEVNQLSNKDSQVKKLRNKINTLIINGNNLTAISDRIESRYPGMVTKLRDMYPNLSDTEIKYCLFVKLNLSTKETANILGVTPDTVKTSRSRIKKKMNIPESLTLGMYLEQL
ncbi:tetratricopeptide repeat protein [Aquimarina sp. BL5]|uniref:tetratricopeptide repeat protein n=2 Tax=Aquimarina sp. BL5 TaxID=1714860 RepID=UPI0013C32D5E|nr:tetratricopeptide repeat protein [Aquimarina sp. BL5]